MADRQRGVLIGARGQRFVDEQVPRYHPHRVEHALVADAHLAQAINQAVAHPLRGHAAADCFRGKTQPWGHARGPSVADNPPTQLATFSSAS